MTSVTLSALSAPSCWTGSAFSLPAMNLAGLGLGPALSGTADDLFHAASPRRPLQSALYACLAFDVIAVFLTRVRALLLKISLVEEFVK